MPHTLRCDIQLKSGMWGGGREGGGLCLTLRCDIQLKSGMWGEGEGGREEEEGGCASHCAVIPYSSLFSRTKIFAF